MLALRYLRARRKESFISVISLFSFLGIMLGVATLIVVMAVLNGFRAELLDKILGFSGHATIFKEDQTAIPDFKDIQTRLEKVDGVKRVISLVEGQAMASSLKSSTGVLVRGISESDIEKLSSINNKDLITAIADPTVPDKTPTFTGFDKSGGIAVGVGLALRHQLGLGSTLTIISPNGPDTVMGTAPRIRDFTVVAIFKIGMSEYDDSIIYMPMTDAQEYFVSEEGATGLEIMVKDPDNIAAMVPALREAAGPGPAGGDRRTARRSGVGPDPRARHPRRALARPGAPRVERRRRGHAVQRRRHGLGRVLRGVRRPALSRGSSPRDRRRRPDSRR